MARRAGRVLVWSAAAVLAAGPAVAVPAVKELTTRYRSVSVTGAAMAPALAAGDRALVAPVRPADIRDGDIVLVDVPEFTGGNGPSIKRVIGTGGDRLACCGGTGDQVRRNGALLVEPYARGGTRGFDLTVEQHRLFLLGDNREDSVDSQRPELFRHQVDGTVPDGAVLGRVVWTTAGAVGGPQERRVSALMLRTAVGVVLTLAGAIALPLALVLAARRRRRPVAPLQEAVLAAHP
ncbi:signal peptidase I [Kitasatospora sp. NPDC059571]|uniref:signal peptidase I n=1 Tax=Kitasatospora sp. NPDC059571 TaxID=3346871 RepID=UPI0036BA74DB